VLCQVDPSAGAPGVVDTVAAVLVERDVDGVGSEVEPVHDLGACCLEVTVRVRLLVGDLGAVAVDQRGSAVEGLGHLVDAGAGRSLPRPGCAARETDLDGCGLGGEAGDRPVALVDARPPTGQGCPEALGGRDHPRPAAQQRAGGVAVDVHEELTRQVVDVEEHLADAAHLA
jgi:hypothetical protein